MRRYGLPIVIAAALVAAPYFFYPLFLMKALCFALFVAAFNLLIGYAGMFSFGHAMFFGVAAYATGHAVKVWHWPTELGILLGVAVGAGLGLVTGLIAIRRKGIYFAMVTLALAQMAYFFCVQANFTGGEDGLQAIPRRPLLGLFAIDNNTRLYFVILGVVALGLFMIHRIIGSPIRPGPTIDPAKRATCHLPRLFGGSLQADYLGALRIVFWSGRVAEGHRLPACHAQRRGSAFVLRRRADGPHWRGRHIRRADRWRGVRPRPAKLHVGCG